MSLVNKERLAYVIGKVKSLLGGKQDTLSAGTGIEITDENEIKVNTADLDLPEAYDDTEVRNLIGSNTTRIETVSGNVDTLSSNLTTTNANVSELSSNVLDISSGLTDVKETLSSNLTTTNANVSELSSNVLDISSGLTDVKETLDEVLELSVQVDDLETDLTKTNAQLSSVGDRVTVLESKEDKDTTYTAGAGISISEDNVISATGGGGGSDYDDTEVRGLISTNAENISALDTRVSALEEGGVGGKTYTAGEHVTISDDNVISVDRDSLNIPTEYDDTAIKNSLSSAEGRIATLEAKEDKDTVYTAGKGITISTTNEISVNEDELSSYDDTEVRSLISDNATGVATNASSITTLNAKVAALEEKTDKDTTYTAGDYINISEANVVSVDRAALNIPSAYDDTEVRGLIGDNTTAIEGVSSSVSSLSETVTTNSTSIATNTTNISTNATAITTLSERVDTLESDISDTINWIINEYEPTITDSTDE